MIKKIIISLILYYSIVISPMLGPCCRFYPSCSKFFINAINKYGCFRGLWLGVFRLFRCHPFSKYIGYDPVP